MGEIIARFADGRLLVEESKLVESRYIGSGVPVRIGGVNIIEKILSIDTDYSQYGLVTPLQEARVGRLLSGRPSSGSLVERADHLIVTMRRGDLPIASGAWISGSAAGSLVSGITSGLAWLGELVSGLIAISGMVTVRANVIAR